MAEPATTERKFYAVIACFKQLVFEKPRLSLHQPRRVQVDHLNVLAA